ncbi:sister chromatid cohesion protein Dcc1 [Tuber indicum]|nr:sister chromatid cohesion protein Dcc1 [Tuber indicum]
MSTQANTGIPFSYSHSQSPIRLLELPPALLSLVTSDSPPIIQIKAAPTPANTTGPRGSGDHAVLCTPTQTFSLRHVHCSNSILLIQPSEPPPPSSVEDEQQQAFPLTSTGLKAIATAGSWLELIPVTPDCASILREKIPVYHGWTDNHPVPPAMEEPISRAQLLDSIPASDAEFSIAWDALLAFETDSGEAFRPSAAAILKAISEINTSATAESFSLSTPSGFTVSAILGMLDDVEMPAGLVTAVIGGMCDRVEESMDDNAWRLNTDKCCVSGNWGASIEYSNFDHRIRLHG